MAARYNATWLGNFGIVSKVLLCSDVLVCEWCGETRSIGRGEKAGVLSKQKGMGVCGQFGLDGAYRLRSNPVTKHPCDMALSADGNFTGGLRDGSSEGCSVSPPSKTP